MKKMKSEEKFKKSHESLSMSDGKEEEKPNLKGDYGSLLVLIMLYVLQGEKSWI
jgi:hypothetical protein